MTIETFVVDVPGIFLHDATLLDIETIKVPTPEGFQMDSGEPMRRRWMPWMVGMASFPGVITIVAERGDDSRELMAYVDSYLSHRSKKVLYGATREFDEMVLRGRFTNARRKHLAEPGPWPALRKTTAEWIDWTNVGTRKPEAERLFDIESRDVAARQPGDFEATLVHNLRDVAELILVAGDPMSIAEAWCYEILEIPGSAERALKLA